MTEFEKRYIKITKNKPTVVVEVNHKNATNWLRQQLNHRFFTNKFVRFLFSEINRIEVELTTLRSRLAWRPMSEGLPDNGQPVLASYANSYGSRKVIRAYHVQKFGELWFLDPYEDDDEVLYEYNDADDRYYLREGWYELIDNWPDYASVAVCEGTIDYWMPIPDKPKEGQ